MTTYSADPRRPGTFHFGWFSAFVAAVLFGVLPSGAAAGPSIHESMYVRIGGIDQWVQIRGDDLANPVLLWLNGGPGGSTIPSTPAYRSWERVFTVVMWDQRGEGRTFEKNGASEAPMTIARMTKDGIELTRYLRDRLHKDRIILLGHSWGSVLGVHMIEARPELFAAYVGTAQITRLKRQLGAAYPALLARARGHNPLAVRELTALGPPPWKSDDEYETVNKWAALLDPPPVAASAEDRRTFLARPRPDLPPYIAAGEKFSNHALSDALASEDLPAFATHFEVPIVFIQGSDDLLTTTSVVRDYFNQIAAPGKRFVELPRAGHNAIFRDRDDFLRALLGQLRSLGIVR